ncbi:MAG: hypothetical protein QNJ46_32150 [Leptolyngbyaceae cyanobacterium MO_188.B28]|nr:hypothetical protein [Leptolyngbyaceae cyanobacterium MO_188.B28]
MIDPASLLLATCANCTPASTNLSDLPTPPCDQLQEPVLKNDEVKASTCVSQPEADTAVKMASRPRRSNLSPSFTPAETYAAAGSHSRINRLHQTLKTAACVNDWDTAIDAASQLIGSSSLTNESRAEFIRFRYRLQDWRAESASIAVGDCGGSFVAAGGSQPANQRFTASRSSNFAAATFAQTRMSNIERHHQALKSAACSNDWETAIDAASRLIGSHGLTDASRQEFIQFRYRLQDWSAENADIEIGNCDRTLASADVTP